MFVKWLLDYGFVNVDNDGVTFVKNVKIEDRNVSKILLSIHVDDGPAACGDEVMYKDFIAAISKDFDLSDSGELNGFWVVKSSRIVKRALCDSARSSIAMTCSRDSR